MPHNATLERRSECGYPPPVILTNHEQKAFPTFERQPRMVAQLIPFVTVKAAQVAELGRFDDPMNELRCGRWMPQSAALPGRAAPRPRNLSHFASAFLVNA